MTEQEARKYKVGQFFTLWEFLRSTDAVRHNLTQQQLNIPNECIENIKNLCKFVLDPLRLKYGVITINSGYRCPELNEVVGGKDTSQHLKAMAADIVVQPITKAFKHMAKELPYDQLIDEYDFSWIHVSFNINKNRHQILRINKNGVKYLTINDL